MSPEPKDERVSKGFLAAEGADKALACLKSVDAAGASLGLVVSGGFANENGDEGPEVLKLGVNTELKDGAEVGGSVAADDGTWELLDEKRVDGAAATDWSAFIGGNATGAVGTVDGVGANRFGVVNADDE